MKKCRFPGKSIHRCFYTAIFADHSCTDSYVAYVFERAYYFILFIYFLIKYIKYIFISNILVILMALYTYTSSRTIFLAVSVYFNILPFLSAIIFKRIRLGLLNKSYTNQVGILGTACMVGSR